MEQRDHVTPKEKVIYTRVKIIYGGLTPIWWDGVGNWVVDLSAYKDGRTSEGFYPLPAYVPLVDYVDPTGPEGKKDAQAIFTNPQTGQALVSMDPTVDTPAGWRRENWGR
jgi:hypothetical protein